VRLCNQCANRSQFPGGRAKRSLIGARFTNFFQCPFRQKVGIALTALGKLDNLGGDSLFDIVSAVASPEGEAGQFEG
jgi:hypothetical protein